MEAGNIFRTLFVVVIGADAYVQTHPDVHVCISWCNTLFKKVKKIKRR